VIREDEGYGGSVAGIGLGLSVNRFVTQNSSVSDMAM